jgi:peptidylprolyl isomerase
MLRIGPAMLAVVLATTGCGGGPNAGAPPGPSDPEDITFAPELGIDLTAMVRTPSGLYLQDLRPGDGFTAGRTSLVTVHYVGYLPDGTVFDTSARGDPFQFRLGGSEVIRGWNQGVPGMKQGGLRRLVVRPSLAYGSRGLGRVPPNTTLIFDVQLLSVR